MDAAKLNDKQKKQVAVAYLAGHPEEVPETLKAMTAKLMKYGTSANQCQKAMDEAENAYQQMEEILKKTIGAIDAVTEMISDALTPEQIADWVAKFEPPQVKAPDFDMAGSTARQMPPPPPQA